MPSLQKALKASLRWFIVGGTLFFLAATLSNNWQEVVAIRLDAAALAILVIALGVTLLSHIWAAWVWTRLLQRLRADAAAGTRRDRLVSEGALHPNWLIQIYLRTNLAKYLPGNVWHFYGRIRAVMAAGVSTGIALLSVVLEPLLMAAAALLIALLGRQQGNWGWQLLSLIGVLLMIHPHFLNPVLQRAAQLKAKALGNSMAQASTFIIHRYPLGPLLGELGFLALRGLGFCLTLLALAPIAFDQLPGVISAFSFAWLLGLIVPGAPGGLGIFEATVITLLGQQYSAGILLSTVALYRLISILAETLGAGLVWLDSMGVFLPARLAHPKG
ncbi:UPF0104 family protein [Trichothermofontia sp.]